MSLTSVTRCALTLRLIIDNSGSRRRIVLVSRSPSYLNLSGYACYGPSPQSGAFHVI